GDPGGAGEPGTGRRPPDRLTAGDALAEDDHVVAVAVVVAQDAGHLVAVLEVEAAGRLVVGQGRRLDEQHPAVAAADVVLGVAQQAAADAPGLGGAGDGDPVEIPGAVGHGGRGVVGEADDLAVALVEDGDVAVGVAVGVVVG